MTRVAKKKMSLESSVHMHFLSGSVHFSGSAKFQKMARDQKFKFTVTGNRSQTTDHSQRDYYKHDSEIIHWVCEDKFWGDN